MKNLNLNSTVDNSLRLIIFNHKWNRQHELSDLMNEHQILKMQPNSCLQHNRHQEHNANLSFKLNLPVYILCSLLPAPGCATRLRQLLKPLVSPKARDGAGTAFAGIALGGTCWASVRLLALRKRIVDFALTGFLLVRSLVVSGGTSRASSARKFVWNCRMGLPNGIYISVNGRNFLRPILCLLFLWKCSHSFSCSFFFLSTDLVLTFFRNFL